MLNDAMHGRGAARPKDDGAGLYVDEEDIPEELDEVFTNPVCRAGGAPLVHDQMIAKTGRFDGWGRGNIGNFVEYF